MKKIISILICCMFVISLTGCNNKNKFEIGDKSEVEITNNDVLLSIKEGSLTRKGVTLILTNNSDKNYSYGNPYEIEIKKNGEWHKINVELYFTLPALHLASKESKELEIDWEYGYGKLANGTYRIIKNLNYENEDGTYESFNVAVEFTIK